jgi:hypothetical protein
VSTTASARRAAPRRSTSAAPAHRRTLRSVPGVTRSKGRRRATTVAAVTLFSLSLLAVVVGNALLAQGQLRIGSISSKLTQEQAVNRQTVLNVAALETPARIEQAASGLHLVQPVQVLQLPSVPLDVELPPIKVAPAGS